MTDVRDGTASVGMRDGTASVGMRDDMLAGTAYGDMAALFDAMPVDPRFVARRDHVEQAIRNQRGRRAALAVLATFMAVLVGLVAASGLFAARVIEVRGARNATADEVRRAAGVHGAPSMLRLDTAAVARRVEREPWVADAEVSVSWPNTLVIHITEWEPIAYVPDRGHFALLASNGRVLDNVVRRPTGLMKVVGASVVPRPGGTLAAGTAVDIGSRLTAQMRRQVIALDLAGGGVALRLANGIAIRLGDTTAITAKVGAALGVLAVDQPGRRYIDVSVPSAPVSG